MQILKYLMDSCYCLMSGQGVCWKGQSLETLKQTAPAVVEVNGNLLDFSRGWLQSSGDSSSCAGAKLFFGQAAPHSPVCGFAQTMRWVWGCRGRAGHSQGCPVPGMWGHAHGHKLPAAPTSLLLIQQEKHQDPAHECGWKC